MGQNGENCISNGCLHTVHAGYKYCLQHLKDMTELAVEKIVINLVIDQLGVEANEVTRRARFIDDLGADSLDAVALAIEFGAAFDFDIPREDVEKIQGIRDAITYVTTRLLSQAEPRFIVSSDINVEAIRQKVEHNPENISRLLEPIVRSPLFQDYFSRLKLTTDNVEKVFRLVIRDNWIDHVTTAPDFDDSKKFLGVSVIFLCREVIYCFNLKAKTIAFTSFPLAQLRLSFQIHYSDDDEISEIEISGRLRDTDDATDTFTFETQEGVEGALTFLSKCLQSMEAVRE